MGKINWNLSDPDLGLHERLGLAGIALALDAADESGEDLALLRGTFTADSLELEWPEDTLDEDALAPLVDYAWQTRGAPPGADPKDRLGVLYLPGVHRDSAADVMSERLVEHNGVMSTFLQHPRIQGKTKPIEQELHLDEGRPMKVRYVLPKKALRHPVAARKKLFKKKRISPREIKLSAFILPGCTARHAGEESWTGTFRQAFPLFFMPTAAYYLHVKGSDWVVVLPDVRNLEEYVDLRSTEGLGLEDVEAGSAADAGLRVLVQLKLGRITRDLASTGSHPLHCEVLRVGGVAWNRQQVRNERLLIRPTEETLGRFEIVQRQLPNRYRQKKDATGFINVPSPRGAIARNIVSGQYWYKDLFEVPREQRDMMDRQRKRRAAQGEPASIPRIWFEELSRFYRQPLRNIMEQSESSSTEEYFVDAFHTALRTRYGQEANQAERGSRDPLERIRDFTENLRRRLTRAQTRTLLRAEISAFFAGAGRSSALQEHRREIWEFIDDPHDWRRARDLALLSLATYQKKAEEDALKEGDDPDTADTGTN